MNEREREASYVNAVKVCFVSSPKFLLDFGNIQSYPHKYIRRHTVTYSLVLFIYLIIASTFNHHGKNKQCGAFVF